MHKGPYFMTIKYIFLYVFKGRAKPLAMQTGTVDN